MYRLSQKQKREIAQNLIDILDKDAVITDSTCAFVGNWILTGPGEKTKDYFDVWDIVLKNYLPKSRPVLFRVCHNRQEHGRISSFTGRLECARRFRRENCILMICDTKEMLEFEDQLHKPGQFKHTFYPLYRVLEIAEEHGGWGFSDSLMNNYLGEEEYIMKVDLDAMQSLKWEDTDL